MTDYSVTTDFSVKDALPSGDAEKTILGSDVDTEFDAIAVAIATKYDTNDLASQAAAEAGTDNTVLMTPLRTEQWKDNTIASQAAAEAGTNNTELMTPLRTEQWSATWGAENGGAITDIQALADPGGDRYMGWNDTTNAVEFNQVGLGVEIDASTKLLQLASTVAGVGLGLSGGVLAFNPTEAELGTMSIEDVNVAQDGVVVSDNGTAKFMPLDEAGIPVVNATDAIQTFALADANTLQVLDGTTTRVWTIPTNASVAFKIGTVILLQSINTATITVTASGGVVLTSVFNTASTAATSDTVDAGGRAALIKVAADEWTIAGDVSD
jgi:hypothetical protein